MSHSALPGLIGHRGAPTHHRENTLAAIEAAVADGAAGVEIDVRLTADGVPVLLHDETLQRLWGDPRPVAEVPWAEVAQLGSGEARIPRLSEVLERHGTGGPLLVLDVGDVKHARVAAAAVTASGAVNIAWCGAPEAMAAVRETLPDASIWLAWETLAMPDTADLTALRPDTLNVDVAFLTADLAATAHRLGLRVACWTVNDPDLATWAADAGADLITTDRLTALGSSLEAWLGSVPQVIDQASGSAPAPIEIVARAHMLALAVTNEVVALTIAHPVTSVTTKEDAADLVTDVDRMLERHVRARVREAFPTHGFSGEEYGDTPGDRFRWWLDPVDGTTNLARGVHWTSVSLCLTHDNEPVVGVVADPWRGEVMSARRGSGAFRNAEPMSLPPTAALAGAIVGTELHGHRPWPGFAAFLDAVADRMGTLRVMGSGTMTLAQVASGSSVAAAISAFDPIDHGAAFLLVQEAGGVIFESSGPVTSFPGTGKPILATHPAVADQLFELWLKARAHLSESTTCPGAERGAAGHQK